MINNDYTSHQISGQYIGQFSLLHSKKQESYNRLLRTVQFLGEEILGNSIYFTRRYLTYSYLVGGSLFGRIDWIGKISPNLAKVVQTYLGAVNNEGQPHGVGSLKLSDGTIKKGLWEFGIFKGGPMDTQGSSSYRSTCAQEVTEGGESASEGDCSGEVNHDEEDHKYIGNSINGKVHSHGTIIYPTGDKYIGGRLEVHVDMIAHGQGTCSYFSGDEYVGEWVEDEKHGQGKYTFANSGATYVGEWVHDQMHGIGTLTFPNGEKYVGSWVKGKKDGYGKHIFSDGDGMYFGDFVEDKMHGLGVGVYPDGDEYVGEWVNDEAHGQGTRIFSSGDKYVGEWMDGGRSGYGEYTFANNGGEHRGYWEHDLPHGKGTRIFPDGKVSCGDWVKGVQKKQEVLTPSDGMI